MSEQVEPKETMDVDQMLADIESPTGDEIQEAPAETVDAAEETPAAPVWNGEEWAFDHNGKKVIPDSRDKLVQWASMGHNYSQRVGEWNNKEKTYQQQLKEHQDKLNRWSKFEEVDRFAAANPGWAEQINEAYKNRNQQQTGPQVDIQKHLEPVMQKLSVIDEIVAEREQQKIEKEDSVLDAEIEATRKQFANIDFNSRDDSGKPLELRILEHAQAIGTKSFRAAARDYLHDHIIQSAKSDSLQKAAKQPEVMAKNGIIGKSPTPKKVINPVMNVRNKSWDQIGDEALADLGLK